MRTRATGIALALAAALVSGVSIYVNGRAVRHFADATVYTTAKNLVAGVLLVALAVVAGSPGATAPRAERPTRGQWLALFSIGVVGGSVPFVLFFEGLARAEATQAAFIQKTLVIWVALLAVPLLLERFGWPHLLAVCLLVAGQAWLVGHSGTNESVTTQPSSRRPARTPPSTHASTSTAIEPRHIRAPPQARGPRPRRSRARCRRHSRRWRRRR